jgi:hypothetical protein
VSASERLGAVGGLGRSLLMVRANWELIALAWLQTALAVVLFLASLAPFYFALDLRLPPMSGTPDEASAWVTEAVGRTLERLDSPAFWLAVLSSSAVAVALVACYSFFQAGAFGVLTTADRQAPGEGRAGVAWFRTYTWTEFQGRGGRHLWRFFWLFNLVLLLWLAWLLLAMLAIVASALAAEGGGLGAALGIGCAAVFPLGFLFVLLVFWALFAQADIAATDSGPWKSLRGALRLLTRRLGAVALLFLVFAVASVAVTMLSLAVSLPLSSGLLVAGGVRTVATLLLQGAQWLVAGALQLTIAGAVVAIARDERERERLEHAVVAR